ncbi:MAG TPA: FHA domain-containing protein [Gemmatimonadaceae bacterium]|nr:FHA domain-containing protein [Gemmatimonadaceae bacterium]
MPVIKVNDQQYSLRPGPNRVGAGMDADVRVDENPDLGVQAIVDVAIDSQAVIRRAGTSAAVRVNGVPLVDPTPLIHGDKVEIGGRELFFADDTKAGATQYVSANDVAALAQKRSGPARATAATGGRLVSLVDGKEYAVPSGGLIIGRDAASGVVVAQNEVSRKHAEVVAVDTGYEVRDFSANGVFVNGNRVDQAFVLSRADVIRVGSEEFRFYADVPASAPKAAPAPAPEPPPAATPEVVSAVPEAPPAKSTAPVLAVLEITNEGPTKGTEYEIRVPLAHVGRGAHNDVVIADDSVSDTHAKLQRRDDGWYLVDVGSTNGTYVGGQRIAAERRLDGAPDIRFGGVKAVFRAKDSGADTNKGTRAIASVDRSVLRETAARPAAPQQTVAVATPEPRKGLPGWIWGVVVLAIGAAAAFFLLNR